MDIMNVLRTGMNMSLSHIHVWLCNNMTNNILGQSQNFVFLVDFFLYFANGPGDLGSIQGRVIPKTLKMVLDTSLLNTQQYKVHIKGKVEQSRERSSANPYMSV